MAGARPGWTEQNRDFLAACLAVLRLQLTGGDASQAQQTASAARAAMEHPPALEILTRTFDLSAFERDLLLLTAAVELDGSFAALCAETQGNPACASPTFGLALARLPDAHWSAIAPGGPLRRWRLLEVEPGPSLTASPLRIDERILHELAGVPELDERLRPVLERLIPPPRLCQSQSAAAERLTAVLLAPRDGRRWPVFHLGGNADAAKRNVAARACAEAGLQLHAIRAADIPALAKDREELARTWERECLLSGAALLVEVEDDAPEIRRAFTPFLERVQGFLLVASREPAPARRRPVIRVDVEKPPAPEQEALWMAAAGAQAEALDGAIRQVVAHFDFDAQAIYDAGVELRMAAEDAAPQDRLWEICRRRARPRLDDLAQRIDSRVGWDDLVLPPERIETLREIAANVRQRFQVHHHWGFAAKGARGLGISSLFAGASGTGKTLAAEVLASELKLDLYRIDLSAVVSKYIGETEKNLRRVFDAAEEGGAILLFDEADALFGKRSEVRDSHDRYANIEVSYLLQRMETHRGLAILTTNMKNALDSAFLRRIRFIVMFPFPDAAQRAAIWRGVFPKQTPAEGLDAGKLAQLAVAGGSIRNIAMNAAFLAADEGRPVAMRHVLAAARSEYRKLEKPMAEAETGGWIS